MQTLFILILLGVAGFYGVESYEKDAKITALSTRLEECINKTPLDRLKDIVNEKKQ